MLLFICALFFNSHDALLHWRNLSLEFLHSRYLVSVTLGYISSVMKLVEVKDVFAVEAQKFGGWGWIPGGPIGFPVCRDH